MRIAGIEQQGIANGPGLRLTVFAQGCAHNCPGCHNPETHDFKGGDEYSVQQLFDTIMWELKENPLLTGVTFSGGDPMYQAGEFGDLAKMLIKHRINIWLYTGFTFEEIMERGTSEMIRLFAIVDMIVDGPFIKEQRNLDIPFRGSMNQRLIDPLTIMMPVEETDAV